MGYKSKGVRVKRVCLVTPNHISTNPRLVKEAQALSAAGYQVQLVFTQSSAFERTLDEQLLQENKEWMACSKDWTGDGPASKWNRISSGFQRKLAQQIWSRSKSAAFAARVLNRHYRWQLSAAINFRAHLYIAHNLGALPVVVEAARATDVKAAFDAEDFHRYESTNNDQSGDVQLKRLIEEIYLPQTAYLSAASPMIGECYQRLFPNLAPQTILNVFPRIVPNPPLLNSGDLKLFWFSQTVGENRGLELVVAAMGQVRQCKLLIVGNASEQYKAQLMGIATDQNVSDRILFHAPVPEQQIFALASGCDIGLACETGTPLNRAICLTNKLFTYIQSGLAVLASDTQAQQQFFDQYTEAGIIYQKESIDSLANALQHFITNRAALFACRQHNYTWGQNTLNWEREQTKYIQLVDSALSCERSNNLVAA